MNKTESIDKGSELDSETQISRKLPAWIDVNGSIGCPATAEPKFRNSAQLLARMDRLGVGRAIVFHIGARDYNPTWGNQKLLAELAPGSERLIPAFVVGPSQLYENGAMEHLHQGFASQGVRAIRLCPATLRYRLSQVEPILTEVARYKPIVLVDKSELNVVTDLVPLARMFPEISFVYGHVMWGEFSIALDFMQRCENILLDISTFHMRGAVELVIKKFGPQRLVFGLGPPAHNGASIAELMDVPITGAALEMIAHGNIESLLNLPAWEPQASSCQGRLWTNLLEGKPQNTDILDAHAHIGSLGLLMHTDGSLEEEIADLLQRMDRTGIRTAIVSGLEALFSDPVAGNFSLEEALGSYKDRFLGYVVFNPWYAADLEASLDAFFSGSFFVGFKILCDYWRVPVTDPRFETVWAYAHRHHLPILLHTWEGPYNQPGMLKDIVKNFPDATFLLGHSGGGDEGRREAEELAIANPNVYLEWCGSFCSDTPFEETIRRVGSQQIIFGTDVIPHSPAWEIGRLLSLDVPDETLLPILGANMRKILQGRR